MSEPTEQERADPRLGRVLQQQYRLDKLLGEGGMGAVYRGEQLSVSRPVAIKLIAGKIAENPECVRRFRREAEAMAKLRHPNTVRLYDFGVAAPDASSGSSHQELFMVMELLEGSDLSEQLTRRGRLPPEEALFVTRQVLEALAEAHSLGIVHRDLKPANIFLSQVHGGRTLAKVMDFGIAGIEQTEGNTKLTMTGAVMGTPAYMSPEQAQGKLVDGRSDLYSLGVVLFEMLVGKPPFEADSAVSLLLAQVSTPPPRLIELQPQLSHPAPLQQLLDRLLDKRPEQRPASAQAAIELIDDTTRALALSPHAPTLHATPAVPLAATSAGNAWAAQAQGTLQGPGVTGSHGAPVGRLLWPLAAACVLLAGWVLWPHARTSSPPPVPELEAQPSTGQGPAAGLPLYTVQINTKPAGAGVELAGVEIGKTPYVLQFRRATALRISLDGYAPAELHVDERSEPNLVLDLTPLSQRKGAHRVAAKSAPTAEPAASTSANTSTSGSASPTPEPAPVAVPAPAAKPSASAQPTQQRAAQPSALPSTIPPPSWLSKVPILSNLSARDRREDMLRRGPPYRNVVAAKKAYRAGQLSEQAYEDTIWVLKTQRNNRIQAEKSNYKKGIISRDEYERRVNRIDADYEG